MIESLPALRLSAALLLLALSSAVAEVEVSSPSGHDGHPNQEVLKSVDANSGSKWFGVHEGRPIQWQAELSQPVAVTGYALTSGSDRPSRDPSAWALDGSDDGKRWTRLDEQADQPSFERRRETKHFPVANETAWKFYRFTFQHRDPDHFQLAEIALEGVSMEGARVAVPPTLTELREAGARLSSYLTEKKPLSETGPPKADLVTFREEIQPLLKAACVQCHGPDRQKGDFRIDTLDPDLIGGEDEGWWIEVTDTISQGEMPPPDEEDVELADLDRARVVDWISQELLVASQARRSEQGHTSFRRLTRYEANYALQDLLGLPYDLAADLPPETVSEDGFQNSSEMLQMTAPQFEIYRELVRSALLKATVRGEQPEPVKFSIPMDRAADLMLQGLEDRIEQLRERPDRTAAENEEQIAQELEKAHKFNPSAAHFVDLDTGIGTEGRYRYNGGRYSLRPNEGALPDPPPVSREVLVLPGGASQKLDLGDFLPDSGTLRLRVRARHAASSEGVVSPPDLKVSFGFQPSNNSQASFGMGTLSIDASSGNPAIYELEIPLGEISRNAFRGKSTLGGMPNPSEYLTFQNLHPQREEGTIHIDYLEVVAPYHVQWPPASHQLVFPDGLSLEKDAGEILRSFMRRAWRRPVTDAEVARKLALFARLQPISEDSQAAMVEVLATVLSSPNFLYVVQTPEPSDFELATRLSMFLWSSGPDDVLLQLAEKGMLSDRETRLRQVDRMLADPRAERLSENFVRQWLGLQLLDYLQVDPSIGRLSDELHADLQREPIALFDEMLREDASVLDFLHADYAVINERLARHYGISEVHGSEFRRVSLELESQRGGLLTQAGLLAMNSDGKHSHPLKRGIWLLENILHDPPPPAPPAVPEIDLADPDILKMTLKERMADHRNDPACASCHERIDPWGIAFENYDALGRWRSADASGTLFNDDELIGMQGLKEYLLENRQDQFARAMTHKLTAYALGRPLAFADRAALEQITEQTRREGDGLATLIRHIVTSDLFHPTAP